MVRCGIAIYGCDPMNEDPALQALEPALELTLVRGRGQARRAWATARATGGVRRRPGDVDRDGSDRLRATGSVAALTNNCDVLDRRLAAIRSSGPSAWTTSRSTSAPTRSPRRARSRRIIGRDGAERQTAEELARRLDTINYEVLCAISRRVPREYHRDGEPA